MFNFLNYIVDNLHAYVRYHRAVAELNNLSDRELHDIGLTRGEIPTTVFSSSLKTWPTYTRSERNTVYKAIPSRAF